MNLELGTMLYREIDCCIGMIINKMQLQADNPTEAQWIYGVEWFYKEKPAFKYAKDSYFSNSKYLSEYHYAYIALQKSLKNE